MNSSTEQVIQQAIADAKAGDKVAARRALSQAVRQEPDNARAWYLLSQVVEEREQAVYCLEQVLKIQPENEQAKERLQHLQFPMDDRETEAPPAEKPMSSTGYTVLGAIAAVLILCAICIGGGVILSSIGLPGATSTPEVAQMPVNKPGPINTMAPTAVPTNTQEPPPAPTSTPLPTNTPVVSLTPLPTYAPAEAGALAGPAACVPSNTQVQIGAVTNVIDGDTIDVSIDGQIYTVRYIGMDTPETRHPQEPVEPFGPEAEAKNRELVENQVLMLVKDVSETDQYGRLLRYVFVGDLSGVFVNYEMVRRGYANAVTYPPDVACTETFRQAEEMARLEGIGFWAPTPVPSLTPIVQPPPAAVSVRITSIYYDGQVPKVESDKHAVITNNGSQPVNLQGWRLNAGDPGQDFIFPSFAIQPGQSCRVYTNENHPEYCGFSFGSGKALWNNGGECGYLFDANGARVSEYCY